MVECDVPAFQLQLAGDLKPADYMKLARTIGASDGIPGLRPLRVGLLSSYSFSFIDPFLVVEGARQMRGDSTCQVENAEIGLVVAGPAAAPSSALVLRR